MKTILDLCGGSGAWALPYKEAGYNVISVTLPGQDIRTFNPPEGVYGVLAAPPCEHFSFVRNEKLSRDIDGALKLVEACERIIQECGPLRFWAMENPVGHLNHYRGKPAFVFQPWEFGDPWTKRTGIWGRFNLPEKTYADWEDVGKNPTLYIRKPRKKPNMVWLHKSAYHKIPAYHALPAPETDAAFRAMTPQGFARAFFEANR